LYGLLFQNFPYTEVSGDFEQLNVSKQRGKIIALTILSDFVFKNKIKAKEIIRPTDPSPAVSFHFQEVGSRLSRFAVLLANARTARVIVIEARD